MNQGEWQIVEDKQGQKYETSKDSKKNENSASKMENMLLGLDPITVRPVGSKKDIYLEDHLESGKTTYIAGSHIEGIQINISKNRVTGNLTYSGEKLKSKSKSEPEKQPVGMER